VKWGQTHIGTVESVDPRLRGDDEIKDMLFFHRHSRAETRGPLIA